MTNREVITRAFRLLGMKDAADDADAMADGLSVMQGRVRSLPGATWWKDVEVAAAYTAGENERIRVTVAGSVTITIPAAVSSARSILFCCNQTELVCEGYDDRAPKDGARVQVAVVEGGATTEATYMYRADLGEWITLALALAGTCPVNADLEDDFAGFLAAYMAPEFSVQPSAVVLQMAADCRSRMRARYGKRQDLAVDLTLLRTSSNPYVETA